MPAANIKINGVAASNDDLPINVLVNLDNQNIGGEATFLWTIVDQPPGPADVLSSTVIQAPTFTPKKEGTYLLNLLVNGVLTDQKIVGVRQLKSRNRVLAARETVEDDAVRGWATDAGSMLVEHDDALRRGYVIVGRAGAAGLLAGDVMKVTGVTAIKVGLPGQENVLDFQIALATVAANVNGSLFVLESGVNGSLSPALGDLIYARVIGAYDALLVGAPVVGDPVYVSDLGKLVLAPGTIERKVGRVSQVTGPNYRIFFEGTGSLSVNLSAVVPTSIDPGDAGVIGVALTAARADHQHAFAGMAFLQATATADTTTAGAADALMNGMQILAVPTGTYLVMFSTSVQHSSGNDDIFASLYVNGVQVGYSERAFSNDSANEGSTMAFEAIVVIGAPVTVEVRWRTSAATATAHQRALTLVRIA